MDVCRLCLASCPDGIGLFLDGNKSWSKQLEEIFQIKLEINEALWPSISCGACIKKLEDTREFRSAILSAQDYFNKFLVDVDRETTNPNPDKTLNEEPDPIEITPREDPQLKPETSSADQVSPTTSRKRKGTEVRRSRPKKTAKVKGGRPVEPFETKKLTEEELRLEDKMREMNLLSCGSCVIEFQTIFQLNRHARMVHHRAQNRGATVECCDRKFEGQGDILDHMRYHENNEAFKCPECGRLHMNKRKLKLHLLTHKSAENTSHICPTCGKGYHTAAKLFVHTQYHIPADQRQFSCPHCDKKFLYQSKLNLHIRAEHIDTTNLPPLLCDLCGKAYTCKDYLRQHVKAVHTDKQSTECDICGKQVLNIRTHKRIHGPAVLIGCEVCGKEFPKRTLPQHMRRVHSGESHECQICNKTLSTTKGLIAHMKSIHYGEKFRCYFCDFQTACMSNRSKHHRTSHPAEYAEYMEIRDKQVKIKIVSNA